MIKFSDVNGKKFVKDFHKVLKDMEKYVKDARWLWHSREFTNFNLRAREIWSLWLLCVVFNRIGHTDLTFGETDESSDGVLVDKKTGQTVLVENVAAMNFPGTSLPTGEERIIQAIMDKASKGKHYAEGKVLVVFSDGAVKFEPNKIAKAVHGKHFFERIYVISLHTNDGGTNYSYIVLELNPTNTQIAIVRIKDDFTDWDLIDPTKAFIDVPSESHP